jgi:hypothetical protein
MTKIKAGNACIDSIRMICANNPSEREKDGIRFAMSLCNSIITR